MRGLRHNVAWTLATWFGCGLVPRAPGTMGALGAIPLYLLVAQGGRLAVVAAAAAITAIGVWASSVVARELGKKDPQIVVIDEVAGMLLTMTPVAAASWPAVVVGFVAFRVLDMTKPWPIRRIEGLPGGWGIVLDDVAAGAIAAGLLAVMRLTRVLP
jgi:phosphatidylglycerophosphatase A